MRTTGRILSTSCLATLLAMTPLGAEDNIEAAIQAAQTARNPEALETQATKLESHYHFDSAKKLLDAALTIRGQVNGDQSADYGLCLLKLGALERKTGHGKEAAAHYATAVHLLPGRPETAPVYLYLGIASIGKKDFAKANEHLQRAQSLDISLTGQVTMWTGLMHERQHQPDLAEAAYKSALDANAGSIGAFETATLYGQFLKEQGRDSEAQVMEARATAARGTHQPRMMPLANPLPRLEPTIQADASAYKVGGGVTPPSVILKVDPEYSEEARVAHVSGSVLMKMVVGVDGQAQNISVVKSFGFGLDDCAISAVSRWRFNPGQKNGNPVPVYATVEVNFRLL